MAWGVVRCLAIGFGPVPIRIKVAASRAAGYFLIGGSFGSISLLVWSLTKRKKMAHYDNPKKEIYRKKFTLHRKVKILSNLRFKHEI